MSDFEPIWIECKIRRPGGTKVAMNAVVGDPETPVTHYHFQPMGDDERHLALVGVEAHVERFLSITEAYRFASGVKADGAGATPPKPAEPVKEKPTAEKPKDEPISAEVETTKDLGQLSREELEATFRREVGRAANPRAKDETLIAIIETTRDEKEG